MCNIFVLENQLVVVNFDNLYPAVSYFQSFIEVTPIMADIHDINTRNFLRNLAISGESFFLTPWAGVIIRNCDMNGSLILHSTIQTYVQSKIPFWLYLPLKLFRDDQGIYGAFICPTCKSMSTLPMMTMDQQRDDIEQLLCLHSVAAAKRTGDSD